MVENQHRKITGYRDLSESEINMMNSIKAHGRTLGSTIEDLEMVPWVDKRWLEIAKTDLQMGIMALVRSIARPTSF